MSQHGAQKNPAIPPLITRVTDFLADRFVTGRTRDYARERGYLRTKVRELAHRAWGAGFNEGYPKGRAEGLQEAARICREAGGVGVDLAREIDQEARRP